MKAYKKFSTAKKRSGGRPIIKVGDFYIVGAGSSTQIAVLDPHGLYCGHVSAKKLDRLGNANWAKRDKEHQTHNVMAFTKYMPEISGDPHDNGEPEWQPENPREMVTWEVVDKAGRVYFKIDARSYAQAQLAAAKAMAEKSVTMIEATQAALDEGITPSQWIGKNGRILVSAFNSWVHDGYLVRLTAGYPERNNAPSAAKIIFG